MKTEYDTWTNLQDGLYVELVQTRIHSKMIDRNDRETK